jgi:hypothetical protein
MTGSGGQSKGSRTVRTAKTGGKSRLRPETGALLDARLRSLYEAVLAEPLPGDMLDLLQKGQPRKAEVPDVADPAAAEEIDGHGPDRPTRS